jgi:hypothetical protein
MTSLERFAAEIVGALVLTGAFFGWWKLHNHEEQNLGAQNCIQQTTVTKSVAVERNLADASAQADQLKAVAASYDARLADLSRGNDDLVRRLRLASVRRGPMCDTGPAAAKAAADAGLSNGEGETRSRPDPIADDTRAVLDACDADYSKMIGLADAYNDWRDRMIKENGQRSTPPAQGSTSRVQ